MNTFRYVVELKTDNEWKPVLFTSDMDKVLVCLDKLYIDCLNCNAPEDTVRIKCEENV